METLLSGSTTTPTVAHTFVTGGDLARSAVAIAVRAGAPRPAIDTEAALREAVLSARTIGYSPGPSGVALLELFEHWGIAEVIRPRVVQVSPGVPVGTPLLDEHLLNNSSFDTCVYHQPGIDLLTKVIPAKNILFASEMISAVCIDATANLTVEERFLVYEGNARRVFPRLDAALKAQGR